MQKLLQSNYKWWYLFIFSLKAATVYRASEFAFLFGNLVGIAGVVIVWYANIASGSSLYTFSFIFTYFIIGRLFFDTSEAVKLYYFASDIAEGDLNQILLVTDRIWLYQFLKNAGRQAFRILIEFILIAIVALIGWQYIVFPAEIWQWVCFLILVGLNFLQNFFLEVSLSSLNFFFTNSWGFTNLVNNIKLITSGRVFLSRTTNFRHYLCSNKIYFQDCF